MQAFSKCGLEIQSNASSFETTHTVLLRKRVVLKEIYLLEQVSKDEYNKMTTTPEIEKLPDNSEKSEKTLKDKIGEA